MKSSNLRAHAVFLAILLVFCYFVGQSATADINSLPESVIELLSGKTTDVTGIANQIPEHQLPTALAAAKLLKFRALHGETSLSSNEAESFETILLDRMSTARQVAFSQNETCRKKVEQRQIMFDGQKLLVPEHFVADTNLAIISCQPKGEAGSLFPDFSIEVFSQSQLTEVTLAINGQTVNTKNILIKQSENAFELSYRTPATPDSLLAVGTHTAEIAINNQSGETVKKEWLFTVGVHDTSTLPLTADAVIISEIDLPLEKFLPGVKALGQLTVVVYQNAAGTRFTEYRFTTATGQTIISQNLAFIARKISAGRDSTDELSISPQTRYAFAGNLLNFSYAYSGPGNVISEKWLISSGGNSTTEPVITMSGGAAAKCTVRVEKTQTNSAGEEVVYQYDVVSGRYINQAEINKVGIYSADAALKYVASCSFAIENNVVSNITDAALVEGKQYPVEGGSNTGILTVDKLSWHIHASEGSSKIENPSATSTKLISNVPGYAELILDIQLTWQEAGETYTSSFKPSVSALFANYPITAKAEFSKYPPGIVYLTSRHIELKSFEFSIKGQKRLISNPGGCELANPILICQSTLWPASAPIIINKAVPMLSHGNTKKWLDEVSPFTFQTPMETDESIKELPLSLGGDFHADGYPTDRPIISKLPSVTIFRWDDDLLNLNLDPVGPITAYEGAETKFSAEVQPAPGMGSGILSETDKTLDLLDGYKVTAVEGIIWFEAPIDADDDWKNKATSGQDYSHVFNPEDGPGSYTMNCSAVMKMQESDTGDSFIISAENNTPVDFLPGLRIFSPINELAYPVNISLKVKTSFDKETEVWKKIKWRLNGKEYHHGLDEAPFFIDLNRTGKWSLQAELTIKNPETDEDMLLKDHVDFVVNPVEINLTPTRKVLDFSTQKSQELSLNITLNGKKVEKPGKPVEWNDDGLKAEVDPIEWFSAKNPNDCAAVNHDEGNLIARVDFTKTGAVTVLATVTVRLTDGVEYFRRRHKGFEDEFEEPIFTFPATRTDLWAIEAPVWLNTTGKTATRAIQETNRLFSIVSGKIKFYGKEYDWNSDSAFADKIKIPAAIPTVSPLTSVDVKIRWEGPEGQSSEESEFKPKFAKLDKQQIIMNSAIEFGSNGRIEFSGIKTDVYVKPLAKVIYTKATANPSAVAVNKPVHVSFRFGEINPVTESQTQLKVWNGEYDIVLDSVDWSSSGGVVSSNEPNIEFSGSNAGQYIITGKPHFSVKPQDCNPVEMTLDPSEALVKVFGSLISIKVDKYRPDHLDRIRNANEFGTDIYTLSDHEVWTKNDFFPLVVGCDSEVVLIPEFSTPNKNKNIKVRYQWLYEFNGNVATEGSVDLNEKITIPTPVYIAKYQLQIQIIELSEVAIIPEVYVVKKITEDAAFSKPFYIRGVDDSVLALTGNNLSTSDDDLVEKFYEWWWSDHNELKYFENAHSAIEVIQKGGGMCAGLADYFAMCLQCQSIAGVDRFSVLLHDTPIPNNYPELDDYKLQNRQKSNFPQTTEYWGAVVYKDHGLHCETAYKPLPWQVNNSYNFSKVKMYSDHARPIPNSGGTNTMIVCDGEHSQLDKGFVCPDVYVFLAPYDGHVIVRFKTKYKTYMYDPSFGKGLLSGELDDFPNSQSERTIVKHFNNAEANKPKMWEYFQKSVGWVRGSVPFTSTEFQYGISVFDIPMASVNFLEVRTSHHENLYETYK